MAVMLHSWRRYGAVCALSSSRGLPLRLTDLQTCGPFSNRAHHSQLQSASPKKNKIIKILRILLEEIKLWSIMPPLIGMYKCQISLSVMQTPFTTSMFSLDFQPLKIYRAFIKLYLPNVLLKRCQTGFLADEPECLLLLRRFGGCGILIFPTQTLQLGAVFLEAAASADEQPKLFSSQFYIKQSYGEWQNL